MQLRYKIIFFLLFTECTWTMGGCSKPNGEQQNKANTPGASLPPISNDRPNVVTKSERRAIYAVERNSCVYNVLLKAGFTPYEIHQIVEASQDVYPLHSVKAGTNFEIIWQNEGDKNSTAQFLAVALTPVTRLEMQRLNDGSWKANLLQIPFQTRLMSFTGVVKSSLWESASTAGMDSQLIGELATIFAWQVDFNREVRMGDHWRILAEQKHVQGKPYEWGNILAAEYVNKGTPYTGIRFPTEGEHASYFDLDGKSLRKMFLKAPVKFSRITSYFKAQRFHPILKLMRPHLGVDYGAPTGTPVMSVGSGKINFAGWAGDSGYKVTVKHNSIYSTSYLHLHNIAAQIKPGVSVDQGQVIGFVGMTGLATGPHCHFAFYENGRYVDPLGKKFPSADPIPPGSLPMFNSVKAELVRKLPDFPVTPMLSSTVLSSNKTNWN